MNTQFLFSIIACICFFCTSSNSAFGLIHYVNISDSTVYSPLIVDSINYFEIDIDSDELVDIRIGIHYFYDWHGYHPPYDCYRVFIESNESCFFNPGPISYLDEIGYNLEYFTWFTLYENVPTGCYPGPWGLKHYTEDESAFVGFRYQQNNNQYFGWIELKINQYSFTIKGYAWNSVPGQSIEAGQIN